MDLSTTRDVWFLVAVICALWLTGFLTWVLIELAKLIKQANEIVAETRSKVERVEQVVGSLVERFTSISGYLSLLAEGGKQILQFLRKRQKKRSLQDEVDQLKRDLEEEDDEKG